MIASGSTQKYIIYAIGEIALVVIGILIALQINNNNEYKKERLFEVTMLNEVRNQLILDTSYFNMLIGRCTVVDTSANRILSFYESGNINRENFEHYARNLNWLYFFEYHSGAYDALKASGVEKISKDTVRSSLIELYDFWLPRTKQMLRELRSDERRSVREQMERKIFDLEISTQDDGRKELVHSHYKLIEYDDPLFLNYLYMQHDMAFNGIYRIGSVLDRVNAVLELLDQELGYPH